MKDIYIEKCIYCGGEMRIVRVVGLLYAQCSQCDNHEPYEYLGANRECCINVWNFANRPNAAKAIRSQLKRAESRRKDSKTQNPLGRPKKVHFDQPQEYRILNVESLFRKKD